MKYKLVCFDLDGTIIDEVIYIWVTLNEGIDVDMDRRQKAKDDYNAGKITYSEWADHDVEMWKEKGADKKKIMELLEPLRLVPGAKETLYELKNKGMKLALVSGSLNVALEKVLPEYKEIFDDVFINNLYFNEDGTIDRVEATDYDMERKAHALQEIAKREGLKLSECVFVGDHENDLHIAEEAGFSIAFNCKSDELAKISSVVIKKNDLREILPYILQ